MVPAEDPRRWRSRLGSLPALAALLFVLVGGAGAARPADGSPALAGAAKSGLSAPPQPAAATGSRADVWVPARRAGQWSPGLVSAAGGVPAFRLVRPAGWWSSTTTAQVTGRAARGEVYRGRAPPSGA